MRRFLELVPMDRPVRILDLGGTAAYWRALPALYGLPNVEITILNLGAKEETDANLIVRAGDACAVDYPDNAFDVVHSNSVIEHVGMWRDMRRMAAEVRRLAPRYFIQTPNMWFPIEPHYRLPFVHWLPEQTRAAIIARTKRQQFACDDPYEVVQHAYLLSFAQMRRLFPDATIERERFAGLTKSLIAVRE